MNAVTCGRVVGLSSNSAILDSGTSMFYIPNSDFSQIVAGIESKGINCELDEPS